MQVNEQDLPLARRRSSRRHAPNINRQEVLTLGEIAQLRAQLASGTCGLVRRGSVLIDIR